MKEENNTHLLVYIKLLRPPFIYEEGKSHTLLYLQCTMYYMWNYKTHCKLAVREGFLAVLTIYHSELTVFQVCTELVRTSDHLAALIGASDSLVRTVAGVGLQ